MTSHLSFHQCVSHSIPLKFVFDCAIRALLPTLGHSNRLYHEMRTTRCEINTAGPCVATAIRHVFHGPIWLLLTIRSRTKFLDALCPAASATADARRVSTGKSSHAPCQHTGFVSQHTKRTGLEIVVWTTFSIPLVTNP